MIMKRFLFVAILLAVMSDGFTQSFYNFRSGRDYIVSLGTGVTSYFGDLNNPKDYLDTKPNVNIGLQKTIGNRYSVRAEITWFELLGDDKEADDASRVNRNLNFSSDNFEFNVVGIVDLFKRGERYYQRSTVNFYGLLGVGYMYFNPTTEFQRQKYVLQPLQTEGVSYKRASLVIPMGIGAKFKVSPFFNVGLEYGHRITFTDYIDDVSADSYPDPNALTSDIARTLADRRLNKDFGVRRGSTSDNDAFALLNIKVEYYLPAHILSTSKSRYSKRRKVRRRSKRR